MPRLLVHVEGQTEEQFVQQVLAPYLIGRGYSSVSPRMVGNTRQRHGRGGIKNWMSVRKEILKHLREDRASIATTMVDYYGLPYTWPGRKQANALKAVEQKASALEKAILEDISSGLGGLDPRRFVPYVVMHEFKGLLFSDPVQLAGNINRVDLLAHFQAIRDGFATPEELDDSPNTAPSKRIGELHGRYSKVLDGNAAIKQIGLPTVLRECPLFRGWISRLGERASPVSSS